MARLTLIMALLLSSTARAEDEWKPRFSVALGGVRMFANTDNQFNAHAARYTLDIEATVEFGWVILGAVWIPTFEESPYPQQSFIGGKIGFSPPNLLIAPYVACAAGSLSQSAIFPFDEGTPGQAAGLGFMPEAGVVIGRRRQVGRIWLFGFAMLPTFSVRAIENFPGEATIHAWGFGMRFGL
jgi:hypothetical protein